MNRQQFIAAVCAVIFSAGDGIASAACPPQQATKLLSPNAGQEDYFGTAVAWSGETLLVGCLLADEVDDNAGAVYVYEFQDGEWTNTQTLVPDDPTASQYFGSALAIDPDDPGTLYIGSRAESSSTGAQGSVYVFHRDKSGAWMQIQKLTPDEIAGGAWFGYSLAIDGDTLLVGAPLDTTINGTWTGSAFAFQRDKSGLWVQQQKLLPELFVTPSGSIFGASVDMQGDRAIIGAPYIGNEYLPGSVEIFQRVDGIWTQEQRFKSPVFTGRDRFGSSVKLMGDIAIVGAPRTPPPVSGLAMTFQRTIDRLEQPDWVSQQVILAPDPLYNDQFGVCIAVHESSVMIGAQNHAEKGDGYVHQISGAELTFTDQVSALDGESGDLFSSCIAMTDHHIAIGAWGCDETGLDAGAVYVFNRTVLGDITSNCIVDVDDLLELINAWGPCEPPCPSDMDGNGVVDVDDLLVVINNWSQ